MPERSFDPDERVALPDDDPIEVVRKLLKVEPDQEQEPEQDESPKHDESSSKP
jgi:hypothetical protein